MENPLQQLVRLGQSVWHDHIRRELLTSGRLRAMVEEGWLTGVTSNPTIFEQAIATSRDYDEQIERLAREGKSAEEIFEALAIDDIGGAADVLRPVYDRTSGADGYVSIEVAPRYANDTSATIREARRLWDAVGRPNLMVKIPATREGLPAIEESIRAGINVNVTLIFSLERYDEVMTAYLNGLVRRREAGERLDSVASVASFFVSRVDTLVDKLLEEKIASASPEERPRLEALKGKAAIANARLAYDAFRRKFSLESFALLAHEGARRQRPLWASTSTKNPAYPDVYYVEALIGPDSVDTMPPQTLEAYRDHGQPEVRIDRDLHEARRVMEELSSVGIDMKEVTRKLEVDGVAAFAASYDAVLRVVEERRKGFLAKARATVAVEKAEPARSPTRRVVRKRPRRAPGTSRKRRAARTRAKSEPPSRRRKATSRWSPKSIRKRRSRRKAGPKVRAAQRRKPRLPRGKPRKRK